MNDKQILKYIEKLISFPHGQICKHVVALDLLDLMIRNGYKIKPELIDAIADADDYRAIKLLK